MRKTKLINKQSIFICLLFFISISVYSQNTITGIVTSADDDQPIPGANIIVKGTSNGVSTDFDGLFKLENVSSKDVLLISFIGYKPVEVTVGSQTQINIKLETDYQALDEVVVVGYGTQEARKVSGAISSVSSEDMESINTPTLDNALQGRSSGLHISSASGEPGAETRIRIRGSNSIQGNNEPLIVLDGFPLDNETIPGGGLDASSSSSLSFINMDDVESIEVLKDASATSIYGSRGANGVILITSKEGKEGKVSINLSSETFTSQAAEYSDMMSSPDYADWGNSVGRWDPPQDNTKPTTVWIDKILQTSFGQNHNLSVDGGSKNNQYRISGSYSDWDGIVIGTGFERATLRANLNNKISDKLSLTTNLNYIVQDTDRAAGSNGTAISAGGIIFNALRASPLISEDELEDDPFPVDGLDVPSNPLKQITGDTDNQDTKIIVANITGNYKFTKDLDLTFRAGTTSNSSVRERFMNSETPAGYRVNGRGILINTSLTTFVAESFLTYKKKLGRHSINTVAGGSYQSTVYKSNFINATDFPFQSNGIYGMSFANEVVSNNYTRTDRELQSAFVRANYDYKSKYLVSFSGRLDGSSVFTESNKYAFFPSVSAAWRIKAEPFMQNIKAISNLKLRGGYGETGSQAIQPYQSIAQYNIANYVNGNNEVSGARPVNMGNADLKWETTEQINVGLDLGLLKGRIGLSVDLYEKTTTDLLLPFALPGSAGYNSTIVNRGSIGNKGFEITLSGTPVKTKNFRWKTNFNYSSNKSEVLDLGGLDFIPGPILDNNFMNEAVTGQFVGEAVSVFYGYELDGLIQPEDFDDQGNPTFPMLSQVQTLGAWKYKDQLTVDTDGDGVPDAGDGNITANDRVIIGDPNPDFTFGFNNDFTYKNFSLNVFIQGSYGNELFNAGDIYIGKGYNNWNNTDEWYQNRWTEENQHNNTKYPSSIVNSTIKPTSAAIEDGSYVRLKNVSLRYNVPVKSLKKIQSLQLYGSATNLLTITNYSGADPEVNLFGNRDDAVGIDYFAYPQATTITIGLKLGL